MDTITHALSGALLARATAPAHPRPGAPGLRERSIVALLAAAFPDIDFVTSFIDPLAFLNWHRGITHSLVMLPFWALLLALLFGAIRRRPWRGYYAPAALGIGAHIAGDVITSYGTQVLAPLSDVRLAIPTTFIIDPYFSAIIVAGLIASARWRPQIAARAALGVLGAYVGAQGLLYSQALAVGDAYIAERALTGAERHALPQPLSPANWKVVVVDGERYHETYVNLLAREPRPAPAPDAHFVSRILARYRPRDDLVWERMQRYGAAPEQELLARTAWQRHEFAAFRDFAELPVVYRIDEVSFGVCVWFTDLRFGLPGMPPPFRYGMCRAHDGGEWRLDRLRADRPLRSRMQAAR
jgi:inner membrane protein